MPCSANALGLDQFSMPTKDRVSSSNRGDLSKLLPSKSSALDCQDTPLIVSKQNSFAAKLLAEYLMLQLKVFDCLFLFLAYGLAEYSEHHDTSLHWYMLHAEPVLFDIPAISFLSSRGRETMSQPPPSRSPVCFVERICRTGRLPTADSLDAVVLRALAKQPEDPAGGRACRFCQR